MRRTLKLLLLLGIGLALAGKKNGDGVTPGNGDNSIDPTTGKPKTDEQRKKDSTYGDTNAQEDFDGVMKAGDQESQAGRSEESTDGTSNSEDPGTGTNDPRQQAFDDLPPFTRAGVDENGNRTYQSPTSGYLLDADGNRIPIGDDTGPIQSGGLREPPAPDINQRIKDSPSDIPPGNSNAGWASDVEMKTADAMRQQGITDGEVVINNPSGPCPGCDQTLPYVLEPGTTLTVTWPGGSKTYTGVEW